MDDQLTSAFGSLIIRNQPEETNEISERWEIKENLNDSEKDNIIRIVRIKGCQEIQKNVFRDLQEPKDSPIQHQNDIKLQEYDTVDHQAGFQTPATLVRQTPRKTNIVNDTLNLSGFQTPAPSKSNKVNDTLNLSGFQTPATLVRPTPRKTNIVNNTLNFSGFQTPAHSKTNKVNDTLNFSGFQTPSTLMRRTRSATNITNDTLNFSGFQTPAPSKTNIVNDIKKSSSQKTPELNNESLENKPVRSSPRLNPQKEEEIGVTEDEILNDIIPEPITPVSLPSPLETPYHTPKAEEDETNLRKKNNKSVWMTPQNKPRHQKRRIHIKGTPEVISEENIPDIVTSTPFKKCDVLPESPGLENIYPKVVSPSVNEQSYTSLQSGPSVNERSYSTIQSGYSSSEDVLSTESSICSTSSISKANVSFGIAKVYCFDRCFGIDTVPEEGNFALGMSQVAWEAIDCPIYDNNEDISKSMQKLTIDQRRTLLEESCGSVELDKVDEEDDTCRSPEIEVIRLAREQVGCRCIGACDPATCECALSEIECQVERAGWPCGCTKARCKNPEGRRLYQPAKIKKETRIKLMQTVGRGKMRRSV